MVALFLAGTRALAAAASSRSQCTLGQPGRITRIDIAPVPTHLPRPVVFSVSDISLNKQGSANVSGAFICVISSLYRVRHARCTNANISRDSMKLRILEPLQGRPSFVRYMIPLHQP